MKHTYFDAMHWISIASLAYLLVALEVILDKFLLTSKRVSHPAIYAFYSGMLSLTAVFFVPFGFHLVSGLTALANIVAGIIFVYGILSLFYAIQENEASQVMPVVGAVIPLVTMGLSVVFLSERLEGLEYFGVALLVLGGLLISFDLPFHVSKRKFFAGFWFSVLAGALLAVAFTWFKHFYESQNEFINVFVWTRVGLFVGALSLLAFPGWRKSILNSFGGFRRPKANHYQTGFLFVATKALGGVGSILTNYAIRLGSVTVVNALVSLEYVFVFIFSLLFSAWFPAIFRERKGATHLMQKIISILLIAAGMVLVARHIPR
ncbi:hypothetical protein EPO05_05040 [Patescibacteria group bacterium]|nr:MAG: hypothetical protein EPO05_05040 [Patescibacteria group bacterium]